MDVPAGQAVQQSTETQLPAHGGEAHVQLRRIRLVIAFIRKLTIGSSPTRTPNPSNTSGGVAWPTAAVNSNPSVTDVLEPRAMLQPPPAPVLEQSPPSEPIIQPPTPSL